MVKGDRCDAALHLSGHDIDVYCELDLPHNDHQAVLRDWAFPGSVTILTWHEDDSRNFHREANAS